MSIRAVFFDVDDTLVDFDSANRDVFHRLFGDQDYGAWLALTAELYPEFTSGRLAFAAMREQRTTRFLLAMGQPADAEAVAELESRRMDLLAECYVLFADVAGCLQELRGRGLLLGLITNNESAHQRAKLAATGLDLGFDAVVISGELGVAKPDPGIFEHACALLGVRPAEALHIGDNIETDVRGARGVGLAAAWLDRGQGADHRHDTVRRLGASVISDLGEIAHLLDQDGALESRDQVR